MIKLSTEQEMVMALWLLLLDRLIDVNAAHNFLGGFWVGHIVRYALAEDSERVLVFDKRRGCSCKGFEHFCGRSVDAVDNRSRPPSILYLILRRYA